jgi:hypothetical protein
MEREPNVKLSENDHINKRSTDEFVSLMEERDTDYVDTGNSFVNTLSRKFNVKLSPKWEGNLMNNLTNYCNFILIFLTS